MKDLVGRFAEAERRVRDLAEENRRLRSRLHDLEKDAAAARDSVRELERLRERQEQVRARLARVLTMLDALEAAKAEQQEAGPPDRHA